MQLTPDEINRYARHILLKEVGGAGQQKLKAAKVAVIGAGGLGSPVLQYLAAAGVGTLGIVDSDTVELSNLQRQTIHNTAAVGTAKTDSAQVSLSRINPSVTTNCHTLHVSPENALNLLKDYDFVADGSDNAKTRYCVADACESLKIPLISAAVSRFDGSITTLKPYEKDDKGQLYPTYRCLYPSLPEGDTCAENGIIGALTGIIGSIQALEVIKEITGVGEGLTGRLILVDAKDMRFQSINYKRKSNS